MHCKLSLLSGLVAAAMLMPSSLSFAGQPTTTGVKSEDQPVIQQVQFWDIDRCRGWRRECADRWGWRTERWHRCLARHGCDRHRYGDRWDRDR